MGRKRTHYLDCRLCHFCHCALVISASKKPIALVGLTLGLLFLGAVAFGRGTLVTDKVRAGLDSRRQPNFGLNSLAQSQADNR